MSQAGVLTETISQGFADGTHIRNGVHYPRMKNSAPSQIQEKRMSPPVLAALIKSCQEGDREAMERVFEHFKTPLFNLAYRYTFNHAASEDILQDVFVKVFTRLHTLEDAKYFVGWLYRVAVNTCLSYLRKRSRWQEWDRKPALCEGEDGSDAGDADTRRVLDEAIQSLPSGLKTVFLLHDVQGFKHEEVAEILGCTVGTSKSQLFKARMKIRSALKGKLKTEKESLP